MQIWIFHLWLLKLILWKTGCERATSKVFLTSFTITRHFVIKLLMLQNLVVVKSTSNYIHQLACNCILLFLIPKTFLGIFDKLIFPHFGSWDGVDKNARLQKRLSGLKYPHVLKIRFNWNSEMICSVQRDRMSAYSAHKLKRDSNITLPHSGF